MLVRDLWQHYYDNRQPLTRSPKRYISAWKMLDPYFGFLKVHDINASVVRWYSDERLKKIKPQSLSRELSLLRAVLSFAKKDGLIEIVPFIHVGTHNNVKQRILTKDEQDALVRHSGNGELRLFISLALLTAQRKSAILGLTWERIDWQNRMIDFNDPAAYRSERMKGRSLVPMTEALENILKWWQLRSPETKGTLFPIFTKVPSRLDRSFSRACKLAELANVTPHTLRHTVATNLVRSGISLLEVSRLLGHKTVLTTEKNYLKLSPDYLQNAVSKLTLS